MLHSDVLNVLTSPMHMIDACVQTGDEVVDVFIGSQKNKVKVRKISPHHMIIEDMCSKGLSKMNDTNLQEVQYKKLRLDQEKKSSRDTLCNKLCDE